MDQIEGAGNRFLVAKLSAIFQVLLKKKDEGAEGDDLLVLNLLESGWKR